MDEHAQLLRLCRNLGAPADQADAMARQLAKRADQLAAERGLTRVAAMEYLLRVVVQGNRGEVPPEFQRPNEGQNSSDNSAK